MSIKNNINYKLIIKGKVKNTSPLIIGCGLEEKTDNDILTDPNGNPYIPGSSMAGTMRHHFKDNYSDQVDLDKYFGCASDDSGNQSKILFSDLRPADSEFELSIRDGVRIDNETGIAVDKAKFDYEILEPGAEFSLYIEMESNEENKIKKIAQTIIRDLENSDIKLGAKTNLGFGEIELIESNVSLYDLNNEQDAIKWINRDKNKIELSDTNPYDKKTKDFEIEFDFSIKGSLIIKHYSADPESSDAEHIKSKGKPIIPGTSIKGALKARAEKILNTIDSPQKEKLIGYLFGKTLDNNKGSIPSRLMLNEVNVKQEVEQDSTQQRIKIDRFTGGTMSGALFDSQPIFAKNNGTNRLKIKIKDAQDPEKGLLLLLLKDLWTADLPVGGEKNIGRGVLEGKRIKFGDIEIDNIEKIDEQTQGELKEYVKSLNEQESYSYIKKYDKIFEEVQQ